MSDVGSEQIYLSHAVLWGKYPEAGPVSWQMCATGFPLWNLPVMKEDRTGQIRGGSLRHTSWLGSSVLGCGIAGGVCQIEKTSSFNLLALSSRRWQAWHVGCGLFFGWNLFVNQNQSIHWKYCSCFLGWPFIGHWLKYFNPWQFFFFTSLSFLFVVLYVCRYKPMKSEQPTKGVLSDGCVTFLWSVYDAIVHPTKHAM